MSMANLYHPPEQRPPSPPPPNRYEPHELTGSEIQALDTNGTTKHLCLIANQWGNVARNCLGNATNANAEGKHGTAEEHRKNASIAADNELRILSLLLPAVGIPKPEADQMAALLAEVARLTEDNDRANDQAQRLSEEAGRLRERVKELEAAIAWALGSNGEFRERPVGAGAYWWRTELRNRAGMKGGTECLKGGTE